MKLTTIHCIDGSTIKINVEHISWVKETGKDEQDNMIYEIGLPGQTIETKDDIVWLTALNS